MVKIIVSAVVILLSAFYYSSIAQAADSVDISKLRAEAESGNAEAQENLGFAYFAGKGVPKDYVEAVKWIRKAAEQGHAGAEVDLGSAYQNGAGDLPKDNIQAYMWYDLSAAQGNKYAIADRDALKKAMTAEQIAEAQKQEQIWKQQHSSHP